MSLARSTQPRLILVGLGSVGRGLLTLLNLSPRADFAPVVVGAVTGSHGTLMHPHGLHVPALLAALDAGALAQYPDSPGLVRDLLTRDMIAQADADVLVEASPTNIQTGQPALDSFYAAFDAGLHVVTANKGPLALDYPGLMQRAAQAGRTLAFEGTVMAGTPTLRLAREPLAAAGIQRVRGILNGTSNFMLSAMHQGLAYADVLAQAQAAGYAETDPSADVDGWDAAAKAMILSALLFDRPLTLADVAVSGIRHLTPADVASAASVGEVWKLVAEVSAQGARVQALRLPSTDPLAAVSGVTNAISYETRLLGTVTLTGPGAGAQETGYALLCDLLALAGL